MSRSPTGSSPQPGPAAALRGLPSVDRLTNDREVRAATSLSGTHVAAVVRETLGQARVEIVHGAVLSQEDVRDRVIRALENLEAPRLTPLINGTGVIVHTNLGRSPVSRETAAAMSAAAENYVPVELNVASGTRGGRMSEISDLMRLLSGAEATLVVNNNAAAVLLVLSALAAGKDVVVSRGEAVEIGGGFRIPDVLRQSGATLVEVGTTNRTHPRDYAEAVTERTGVVLKVHPSNFVVSGFTRSTSVAELAAVLGGDGAPIVEDLGSGALLDTATYGLAPEPTIGQCLGAGAAVVTASGDKLLGGPQAGIIAGRKDLVDRIANHPLARAVRADKTCLAGIAATLRHYARGDAETRIPVWRMISTPLPELERRARAISRAVEDDSLIVAPVQMRSTVGGGSLPGQEMPSWGLEIHPPSGLGVSVGAERLRIGAMPVIARVQNNQLLVDLRTVLPEHDDALIGALLDAY